MRKLLLVVPIVMLGVGSTACATKKFVRGEVGQVNTKVDGLSTQLEETQERTKKNEGAHRRGRSEGGRRRQVGDGGAGLG